MKRFTLCVVATLISLFSFVNGQAQATHLVISQVYGGGGNSGATYQNDFIEIFNPTSSTVNFTNWSVQYTSAAGTTWTNSTTISGSLAPGQYFLVKEASTAAVGSLLPT